MALSIGVDVGNSATKSQNTVTPSGYKMQTVKPSIADEWLLYNEDYYIPTSDIFPYTMDKTENGHALILTLFAIAKEILYTVKQKHEYGRVDTQELINQYHNINLGVGLPPGHYDSLAKKTKEYYLSVFNDGITFEYNDYKFKVYLNAFGIFPQDFLAVWKNPDSLIAKEFDKYYIIGIGGYTVDILTVNNGRLDSTSCRSLPLGINVMYENITKEVLKAGMAISSDAIEKVLFGKKTILTEEIIELIKKLANLHAETIIDSCKTSGVNFAEAPVVFFGGGCLLLRESLERNKDIVKSEFIENVNANAIYYAKCIKEK